jgi:ADP-ribose pyrophosphatase
VLEKRYQHGEESSTESYYVVDRPDFVLVVALYDTQLILVEQFRPGTDAAYWALPAGYLEPGENPQSAAKRELAEETTFSALSCTVIGTLDPLPGYIRSKAYVVQANATDGHNRSIDEEIIQFKKVDWNTALNMVRLGEINEMQAVAGILLADSIMRQ